MPTFTYVSDGNLVEVFGCACYRFAPTPYHLYNIGDVLYSSWDAYKKGQLYAICVKRMFWPGDDVTFAPIYVDRDNGVWTESELVSYDDALTLIQEYELLRNANALFAAQNCLKRRE